MNMDLSLFLFSKAFVLDITLQLDILPSSCIYIRFLVSDHSIELICWPYPPARLLIRLISKV